MATIAELFVAGYSRQKALNPKLTPGEYLTRAFPGRYKNKKNAGDAYRRTVRGERSGSELALANRPMIYRKHEYIKTNAHGRRFYHERGDVMFPMTRLSWQVIVHFNYTDLDGEPQEDEERSFVATTNQYKLFTDKPFLEEILMEAAEEYMEEWHIAGSPPMENYQITEIEVVPIHQFQTDNVVDTREIMIGL